MTLIVMSMRSKSGMGAPTNVAYVIPSIICATIASKPSVKFLSFPTSSLLFNQSLKFPSYPKKCPDSFYMGNSTQANDGPCSCFGKKRLSGHCFINNDLMTMRYKNLKLKILTTKAKASAVSRSILQNLLGSVKALAWLELKCYIRFLSGWKTRKEVPAFHGFHFKTGVFQITFCFCPKSSLVRLC